MLPLDSGDCEVSGGHRFFYEHRVARVRIFQGRFDEAADLVAAARVHVGDGDRLAQAMLRGVEARLAAVTGDASAAVTAALEAGAVLRGHESGVPSPCRGALEDPAEALVEVWESALKRGEHDADIASATQAAASRVAQFAKLIQCAARRRSSSMGESNAFAETEPRRTRSSTKPPGSRGAWAWLVMNRERCARRNAPWPPAMETRRT
jgi:ATP/maltotriose-dependent transcriptional regulator MalT